MDIRAEEGAISFLKDFGDNFNDVMVSYNHSTQSTTSEMRKVWAAEAQGRVASYRKVYGNKALRVLSVAVFPTGHTRVDLVADVAGDAEGATPKAPEASRKIRDDQEESQEGKGAEEERHLRERTLAERSVWERSWRSHIWKCMKERGKKEA